MKNKKLFSANSKTRREFISGLSKASAGGLFLSVPFRSTSQTKIWTVGEIIDHFTEDVPDAPFPETVDTLKAGSRGMEVTGIVTTMFATIPVIEYAISTGTNFIIVHEPTYYNHLDETGWLENYDTYQHICPKRL